MVNIDKTFENKYLKLDGKLTSIYKLKKLREYFEDMDPDRDLEQPEAPLKKQRKDNMAKGMTTERTGSSSHSGTPNKELNTLENSKETNKEL